MDFLNIEDRELGIKTSSLKLVQYSRQAFDGLVITRNFPDFFRKKRLKVSKSQSLKFKEVKNKYFSFLLPSSFFLLPSSFFLPPSSFVLAQARADVVEIDAHFFTSVRTDQTSGDFFHCLDGLYGRTDGHAQGIVGFFQTVEHALIQDGRVAS